MLFYVEKVKIITCVALLFGFTQITNSAELPEPPLLKRDVHLVDQGNLTRPTIPANRTTNDGRISLDFSSVLQVEFTLLKPETLEQHFDQSPAGYGIIGGNDVAPFNVDRHLFHNSSYVGFGEASHHTICESTPERSPGTPTISNGKPIPFGSANPYSCPNDSAADCYDLTMIGTQFAPGAAVELWGTPFTVKIKSPKTKYAFIESVTTGSPVRGPTLSGINSWFEPLTSGDGRLLVGRDGFHNMFYAVAAETEAACDVTTWTDRHEITHAYFDPDMRVGGTRTVTDGKVDQDARYGIATYRMKDGAGQYLADNVTTKFTYPWMDKAGDNIFFTSVDATLFYNDGGTIKTRYPAECYDPSSTCTTQPSGALEQVDTLPNLRGIGLFGAWTHGKILLVDNLTNNIDYGTGWGDNNQYNITLYDDAGADAKVRIGGAGNIIGTFNNFPGPGSLPLASVNPYVYIIDSVENLFNDIPNMVPSTIRDTVWYLNLGKVTDKVVFDEWLNPNLFIWSEWMPTLVHTDTSVPAANRPTYMHYRDGFISGTGQSVFGSGFGEAIWFQNGATGLDWDVPGYGLTYQPDASEPIRAEPIAMGGIEGRGLWLFEDNNVTYSVPVQSSKTYTDHPWWVSLYIDPAANDDTVQRKVLTFPDGSTIRIKGREQIEIVANGTDTATDTFTIVSNGSTRQWRHIGFQISTSGDKVDFYLDGFKKGSWSAGASSTRLFRMQSGDFILGRPLQSQVTSAVLGYKGWTDSLMLAAQQPGPELICNYANGTLVGLNSSYTGDLLTQANEYPVSSHTAVTTLLSGSSKTTYPKYACMHDYTSDLDMDSNSIPTNTVSIRGDVNFPEGPLVVGSPRPDSTTNNFCLSCHTTASSQEELKFSALNSVSNSVEDDLRRQPGQGPRLRYGNMPANHYGLNAPSSDSSAITAGNVTDLITLVSGGLTKVDPNGDSDGDSVLNKNDAFPNDSAKTSDIDGDRIDDVSDTDKDGDGVLNTVDAFPENPVEWADADSDSVGDNADPDSNNDGVMDVINSTFNQTDLKVTERYLVGRDGWTQIDPTTAPTKGGEGDRYDSGYIIKRSNGSVSDENGIRRDLLQGGFTATTKFVEVSDTRGSTITRWEFIDSDSVMQIEMHATNLNGTRTMVAAIKAPGSSSFASFGSRVVGLRQPVQLDVEWVPSASGGPGSGTWTVDLGVNGLTPTQLGTTAVTTPSGADDSRSMEFAIDGSGLIFIHIDEITLTPVGGGGGSGSAPAITNGSFESTGSAVYGPLLSADDWTFSGAASTVGVMPNPVALGFPAASDGSKALYIGVDNVGGTSTSGKAYQDIGQSVVDTTYTISAEANADSSWPAGYKLSLRDASTDAELASTISTGAVSISFIATTARSLRLQLETNGAVGTGSALRASVDNLVLTTSVEPSNPATANQVCYFEGADWSGFRACIGVAQYNFSNTHNDKVSAISVGSGVHTIIYSDANYTGTSLCTSSSTNNNILGGLDNAASSFKVIAGSCP